MTDRSFDSVLQLFADYTGSDFPYSGHIRFVLQETSLLEWVAMSIQEKKACFEELDRIRQENYIKLIDNICLGHLENMPLEFISSVNVDGFISPYGRLGAKKRKNDKMGATFVLIGKKEYLSENSERNLIEEEGFQRVQLSLNNVNMGRTLQVRKIILLN